MTPRLTPSITDYIPMPSPVGELLLTAKGDSLSGIGTPLRPDWRPNNASAVLGQARIELAEYFAGTRHRFEIKLRPEGTDFQRAVWDGLLKVQFGKTATYGAVAAQVGRPSAGRAVGAAVGANPIAIIVPCHRIIGRDGSLSGYAGGLDRKVRLLAIEGITLPLEA